MTLRTVKIELEAKLTGQASGFFYKPSGKVERKSYHDGSERLKISICNLKVSDQTMATVTADGLEIGQIPLIKGSGRIDVEAQIPATLPELRAGQTIEVKVEGAVVLQGTLNID